MVRGGRKVHWTKSVGMGICRVDLLHCHLQPWSLFRILGPFSRPWSASGQSRSTNVYFVIEYFQRRNGGSFCCVLLSLSCGFGEPSAYFRAMTAAVRLNQENKSVPGFPCVSARSGHRSLRGLARRCHLWADWNTGAAHPLRLVRENLRRRATARRRNSVACQFRELVDPRKWCPEAPRKREVGSDRRLK